MSKLQASDNTLIDIANMTLANQLESRLKELERNIAVARQFIGMADECYSKVKHEWELLQQDIGVKNATTRQSRLTSSSDERSNESESLTTGRKDKKNKRSESQQKTSEDHHDVMQEHEEDAESTKIGKSSRRRLEASSQAIKPAKKSKKPPNKTE
jgi:hypothetical protein